LPDVATGIAVDRFDVTRQGDLTPELAFQMLTTPSFQPGPRPGTLTRWARPFSRRGAKPEGCCCVLQ